MTVYTYSHTHVCIFIYTNILTHQLIHAYIHTSNSCTHTNISIYTCIHINKYYNIPTSIYQSYTYTHMHTCIHVYIKADIPRRCSDGVARVRLWV